MTEPRIPIALHSAARTDQGSVRANNEDEIYNSDESGTYFVVDGMGGHAAGEEAARIAKKCLKERLEYAVGTPEQRVREAIAIANSAIFEAAQTEPKWSGMACVLTVALVDQFGSVTVGHVGDSRLYVVTAGELLKITRDHSPIGELEDLQKLSEEEAMADPRRNEVFNDVGSALRSPDDAGFIDIYPVQLSPDQAILICSDGLTDALTSAEIRDVLRRNDRNLDGAIDELIAGASLKGKDNISVVLAAGPDFRTTGKRASARAPRGFDIPAVAIPAATNPAPLPQAPLRMRSPRRRITERLAWCLSGVVLGGALVAGWAYRSQITTWIAPSSPVVRGPALVHLLPGESISQAIDRAQEGDTIRLAGGTYRESFRIEKPITLDGAGATIEPPEGAKSIAITIAHTKATILNLDITGGPKSHLRIGVKILDAEATLDQVRVVSAEEAGLDAAGNSKILVHDCRFQDGKGPGILIGDMVSGQLLGNYISENGGRRNHESPGLEIRSPEAVKIEGNTIVNNAAGEIWLPSEPPTDLAQTNTIGREPKKPGWIGVVVTDRDVPSGSKTGKSGGPQ
jgi:serine/threonine protein phosphatase PrpC